MPLVIDTIPANTPDANQAVPYVDAVPPIAGKPGHPRKRPDHVIGDRGFDDEEERQKLRNRGIDPELAEAADSPKAAALGCITPGGGANDQLVSSVARAPCAFRSPRQSIKGSVTLAEILITFRFLDLYGVTYVHHWAGLF